MKTILYSHPKLELEISISDLAWKAIKMTGGIKFKPKDSITRKIFSNYTVIDEFDGKKTLHTNNNQRIT